jgi:hypothetical protein
MRMKTPAGWETTTVAMAIRLIAPSPLIPWPQLIEASLQLSAHFVDCELIRN